MRVFILGQCRSDRGEEHLDTIMAMDNLAQTLGDVGELQEVLTMKQAAVEKRKRILGEDHPDTIVSMQNLASMLAEVGDLQEALTMQREVVEKRKRILGEQHAKTISATENLSILLHRYEKLQQVEMSELLDWEAYFCTWSAPG